MYRDFDEFYSFIKKGEEVDRKIGSNRSVFGVKKLSTSIKGK